MFWDMQSGAAFSASLFNYWEGDARINMSRADSVILLRIANDRTV